MRLSTLYLASSLAFSVSVQADTPLEQRPRPSIKAADLAERIHTRINEERAKQRLTPLAWSKALAGIAEKHSRDMTKRNYVDHVSPEGRGFAERYRRARFICEIRIGNVIYGGAENIAIGGLYSSVTTVNGVAYYDWNSADAIARRAVEGWMKSPGHRKNILTPHWKNEGIGVEIGDDDKVRITQNFC